MPWSSMGVCRYSSTLSWPMHYTKINGQLYALPASPPGNENPASTGQKAGWLQRWSGHDSQKKYLLPLLRIKPWLSSLYPNHCTDWATKLLQLSSILILSSYVYNHKKFHPIRTSKFAYAFLISLCLTPLFYHDNNTSWKNYGAPLYAIFFRLLLLLLSQVEVLFSEVYSQILAFVIIFYIIQYFR
jgi:hypothetical protein